MLTTVKQMGLETVASHNIYVQLPARMAQEYMIVFSYRGLEKIVPLNSRAHWRRLEPDVKKKAGDRLLKLTAKT